MKHANIQIDTLTTTNARITFDSISLQISKHRHFIFYLHLAMVTPTPHTAANIDNGRERQWFNRLGVAEQGAYLAFRTNQMGASTTMRGYERMNAWTGMNAVERQPWYVLAHNTVQPSAPPPAVRGDAATGTSTGGGGVETQESGHADEDQEARSTLGYEPSEAERNIVRKNLASMDAAAKEAAITDHQVNQPPITGKRRRGKSEAREDEEDGKTSNTQMTSQYNDTGRRRRKFGDMTVE